MTRRILSLVGLVQLTLTLVISIALFLWNKNNSAHNPPISGESLSLWVGSLVAMVNFVILTFLWGRILKSPKKSVALPVFLIVIKYGILILVFAEAPKQSWLKAEEFALGVLANPISVIITGLNHRRLSQRRKSSANEKKSDFQGD